MNATEVLRRGFNVTVANWPVIALRIVESILFFAVTIGGIIIAVVPILVSVGLGTFRDVPTVVEAIVDHWIVIVFALLVVMVLLVILVAIHAFFDGGTAQVLIDSERRGGQPSFDMGRWLEGGRSSWWAIFWIYNIVWSIAGLVLLVPLFLTLAGMIAVSGTGRVIVGCAGLAITVLILLPVGVVAAVWTQKAIAVCVARRTDASESIGMARQQMRGDLGRHLIVAFVMIVVSVGGAAVIGMVSAPFSVMNQHQPLIALMTAPAQIVVSFAQSIFSAAAGAWFLASFIALTEGR